MNPHQPHSALVQSRGGMQSISPPVVTLLRLENLALAVVAGVLYGVVGGHWSLFACLILLPDLSMLGYLAGPVIGARSYNLAHCTLGPAFCGLLGMGLSAPIWGHVALIWCVHIGVDRALGFGLKYPTGFAHTHLGTVSRGRGRTGN